MHDAAFNRLFHFLWEKVTQKLHVVFKVETHCTFLYMQNRCVLNILIQITYMLIIQILVFNKKYFKVKSVKEKS